MAPGGSRLRGLLAIPARPVKAGAEPDHQASGRDLLQRRDCRGLCYRMAVARDQHRGAKFEALRLLARVTHMSWPKAGISRPRPRQSQGLWQGARTRRFRKGVAGGSHRPALGVPGRASLTFIDLFPTAQAVSGSVINDSLRAFSRRQSSSVPHRPAPGSTEPPDSIRYSRSGNGRQAQPQHLLTPPCLPAVWITFYLTTAAHGREPHVSRTTTPRPSLTAKRWDTHLGNC
jgi:hypothetical protein